jgi:hypothetical protein
LAELTDEDGSPLNVVAVVDISFDNGEITTRDDARDSRPPRKGPIHLTAPFVAHDPFSRLGQLEHRIVTELLMEKVDVAIAYRLEQKLRDLSILYFTHTHPRMSANVIHDVLRRCRRECFAESWDVARHRPIMPCERVRRHPRTLE